MYVADGCTCGWAPRSTCHLHHLIPDPRPGEVHDLINHLHWVARLIDPEVEEIELDTGLTTRAEIEQQYDARQRMVRRMVRVAHELNSLADQPGENTQPTEYGLAEG